MSTGPVGILEENVSEIEQGIDLFTFYTFFPQSGFFGYIFMFWYADCQLGQTAYQPGV